MGCHRAALETAIGCVFEKLFVSEVIADGRELFDAQIKRFEYFV
jgi:hypothetical protein